MPAIWLRSSVRPGCRLSSTEAEGFCCSRKKPFWLGSARCTTRALHRGQRLDRARELAFEPALEAQLLLELRHAEAVVLHQLEAGHRTLGQALRREPQAHVVHLVGRHHHGAAAFGVLVGDVHLRELRDHCAAVLVAQVGVEHAPVRLAAEHDGGDGDGDQHRGADRQAQALAAVQAGESGRPRSGGGLDGNGVGRKFGDGGHVGGGSGSSRAAAMSSGGKPICFLLRPIIRAGARNISPIKRRFPPHFAAIERRPPP